MRQRIQQIMESEDITPARFADKLQIGRAVISHILNGRNNPSLDVISRILLEFPEINSDWLISGKGTMYRNQAEKNKLNFLDENNTSNNYPDLFSQNSVNPPINSENKKYETEKELKTPESAHNKIDNQRVIYVDKPDKKIAKIIIYYSDNTYESFNPEK